MESIGIRSLYGSRRAIRGDLTYSPSSEGTVVPSHQAHIWPVGGINLTLHIHAQTDVQAL